MMRGLAAWARVQDDAGSDERCQREAFEAWESALDDQGANPGHKYLEGLDSSSELLSCEMPHSLRHQLLQAKLLRVWVVYHMLILQGRIYHRKDQH
jgi:hypothetical protein